MEFSICAATFANDKRQNFGRFAFFKHGAGPLGMIGIGKRYRVFDLELDFRCAHPEAQMFPICGASCCSRPSRQSCTTGLVISVLITIVTPRTVATHGNATASPENTHGTTMVTGGEVNRRLGGCRFGGG